MMVTISTSVIGAACMRPTSSGDSRPPAGRPADEAGDAGMAGSGRTNAAAGAGIVSPLHPPSAAIVLFALGGTISMTGRDAGVVARLTGRDLLGSVSGLDGIEID